MRIGLLTDRTVVRLPADVPDPHPDLVALAAILVARPWVTRRLTLTAGVSPAFAEVIASDLSIEVGPVDASLPRRTPGVQLGLMYSGGPDCMAAELLMGERLPLLHLRRIKHPRIPNRTYRASHVLEALVQKAAERGEDVHVSRSDMEFLSRPFATYPQWASMAIGAVLQAEGLSLSGLVTGRNISGMYLGWGKGFDPGGDEEHIWRNVFSIVGLDLVQPLAGTSDISSKAIAREHRLHDLARSCNVGTIKGPCLACRKCVLTQLIRVTVAETGLEPKINDRLGSAASATAFLEKSPPFPNQHLLEYALARLPHVEQTIFAKAAHVLSPDVLATRWVDRYYRPAVDEHVPAIYRPRVIREIGKRLTFMDSDDEKRLTSWSPEIRASV